MQNPYDINGLVFWTEDEIQLRETFRDFFAAQLQRDLRALNDQWRFHYIEAPLLTPRDLLNVNYTVEDIWVQDPRLSWEDQQWVDSGASPPPRILALRPETTPGSYAYAQMILNDVHPPAKPPFVVWQAGKSFRREIVQPTKHMRLKEFYQQEFQCLYTADTATDYQELMLERIRKMIGSMIHLPTRLVESDRLPAYSLRTMDVEVWNGDKWMEVCSISKRTDFPQKLVFQGKKGTLEKDALVLEVAIGLDRCVYNWQIAQGDVSGPPDVELTREEISELRRMANDAETRLTSEVNEAQAIEETEGQPT
jgi:glycyl-tRNA synthetase